MQRRPKTFAA